MKNTIGLFLILFSLVAAGQKSGPRFSTTLQGGLLEGESGGALQLKAINGVAYRYWTGGIGVGLDYYQTRTIPLFLDVRRSFGKNPKTPFLYASGGANFPWPKQQESGNLKHTAGLYVDAGLGYQFPLRNKSFLFFSAGYSQKAYTLRYYYSWFSGWPVTSEPIPSSYKIDYNLRRLSIQTGLRF
jgi:hypothetical protein